MKGSRARRSLHRFALMRRSTGLRDGVRLRFPRQLWRDLTVLLIRLRHAIRTGPKLCQAMRLSGLACFASFQGTNELDETVGFLGVSNILEWKNKRNKQRGHLLNAEESSFRNLRGAVDGLSLDWWSYFCVPLCRKCIRMFKWPSVSSSVWLFSSRYVFSHLLFPFLYFLPISYFFLGSCFHLSRRRHSHPELLLSSHYIALASLCGRGCGKSDITSPAAFAIVTAQGNAPCTKTPD